MIEVVNLGLTLQGAFDKRSDTPRFETFASVIGASADLGVAMIEAYELLLQATKGTAKGALGMISGICDSVTFVQAVRRASSRYDYDQAFGHGIAAGGAGFVVAGSFCALWASVSAGSAAAAGAAAAGGATAAGGTAIAGGSLLSLGLLLGTGGAIAIEAGMAIATLATDNAYQQFAQLCFLGDEYDPKKSVRFPWSPVVLPARSEGASSATQNEMAAFITLLSSFEVEFTGTSLMIEPRFYRAGDVFEIYVEVHPINYAKNACVLEVDLESEQVTQLRGLRPLRDGSKFFKDAADRIARIEIDLREAEPPSSPEVVVYHGGLARVRLRFTHGKTTWFVPPIPREGKPAQPWVQVSATYGDLGAVLASVRRGSSCDADLHVDGLKQPVQRGMKALHD